MTGNILIKNGIIIDGTNSRRYKGDLLISGDKIKQIGEIDDSKNPQVIDAKGLVVAPGFIDVHTHLDFFFPSSRHAEILKTWAYQGVTTIVAGNCGFSVAPINHEYEKIFSSYCSFALPKDGLNYEWTTMKDLFEFLEKNGLAFNLAMLTGHNTLRTNAMGFQARFAEDNEISEMKQSLKESLDAGSIGLSLGLAYCPGIFSHTDEIIELASVLTPYGAPLVPHIRGLMTKFLDKAVEEVIQVAEKNKIPLHISHHAGGGLSRIRKKATKIIDEAIERGVKISHDNIAWPNSSTTVLQSFPPSLFDGGIEKFFERIKDPQIREKAKDEILNFEPKWPNWEHNWWIDKNFNLNLYLAGFRKEKNKKFENKSIKQIGEMFNKDPLDAYIDLVIEEEGKIYFITSPFDDSMANQYVEILFKDPNCSLGTDIVGVDLNTISPGSYGAFPKILGEFTREKNLFSLEEAIFRMTGLPAQQMKLPNRGVIKKGAFADITIFDPEKIKCTSKYTDPYHLPTGVKYVLINGKIAFEDGNYDPGLLAGKVIKSKKL
ncbi:MAG: hypothetical protein EU539_02970 [Promethearchaeota archaeon]|nr:MAG: hypothetical protein EU539_02970 [Candidatus Lokiarchaeota archaeon]